MMQFASSRAFTQAWRQLQSSCQASAVATESFSANQKFLSLAYWQSVRNSRVNNDQIREDQQEYHDLMWFNSLSHALNHCLYLRVAHGHLFNTDRDSASGIFFLYSGTLRHSLEKSSIKSGRRAHINHLTVPSPESGFSQSSKMNEYFTDFMTSSKSASQYRSSCSIMCCITNQSH